MFPGGFLFQNHYPRFRGAPAGFFKGCPQGRPSVDSGLGGDIEDFANLESSLTSPTFADFLLSPFLTAVQATFVPNLDQFVVRKTQATARIAAFRFILEATESGRLGEVPVDPLTGESFVLTSKGDEYEIASGYLQGGEPAVRYEFRLP